MNGLDAAIQQWLFNGIAQNTDLFVGALRLSDTAPWIVCAVILVVFWFRGNPDNTSTVGVNRYENRQRVLITFLAMLTAFLLARSLAGWVDRQRPMEVLTLNVPIDATIWSGIVNSVSRFGGFPSDQSAFWFALAGGMFFFKRRIGFLITGVMIFFTLLRVAIGYVYPSDAIAGMCIGLMTVVILFILRKRVSWITRPTAELFEGLPVIAYPFGLIMLLDIVQRMTWTISLLAILFNVPNQAP